MQAKGANIKVKLTPLEKVTSSGIIIPDSATPPSQEWAEIIEGYGDFKVGGRVLFYGKSSYKDGDYKIVNIDRIIYYED